MQPQSYIFMGRAGAGKGTQAALLNKLLSAKTGNNVIEIETGAEFRKFIEERNYTASIGKRIVESGGLMPAFMPIFLWGNVLVNKFTGQEHLIFDGTPRLLMEARNLESIFPFYGLGKPWVIYLDIEHEESAKRLAIRAKQGRKDDHADAVERRRVAFENDIRPTIEWYKTNPNVNFLDVEAERPIDAVHADIAKRVGLA